MFPSWQRLALRTSQLSNTGLQGGGRPAIPRCSWDDADSIAPEVEGKFMSAFIRAKKPM
jgi:hypothetical protein